MNKKKLTRIYVDPLYKKQLKIEAAKHDVPVADFTRELAKKNDFLQIKKDEMEKKKKNVFGFQV